MHRYVFAAWLAAICFFSCLSCLSPLSGAVISGKILDSSDAAVAGARVQVTGPVGPVQETTSDGQGVYRIDVGSRTETTLSVSAPGFARKEVAVSAGKQGDVVLDLAPVNDSITVTGSAIAVPVSEQASSITVIPRGEITMRNEAQAADLLRQVPGAVVAQSGQRGEVASLFVRGGDASYNLVLIDGVPANEMRIGGLFDFAHIPTDQLERVEVIRGPQSAVYGSYANASVVNFVTRLDDGAPQLGVVAEGGTFGTRRFAVDGGGSAHGYRGSFAASRLDTDGEVANDDYRNEYVSLNAGKRFGKHDFSARGGFISSGLGEPGPYGSDPAGNFLGIDLVARSWNNLSNYAVRYDGELTQRVRQQVWGTFYLANNSYRSGYGWSFNKDFRGEAESRTTIRLSDHDTLAFGYTYSRERNRNTFITETSGREFPLHRDQQGIYIENQWQPGARWFLSTGVRTEVIATPLVPADTFSGRPVLPQNTITRVNPKIGAAFRLTSSTRLHGSFGTGIRPPGAFDIAFTDNPALAPERTRSFDAGIEQQLGRKASADVTYFHNRYDDLIVSLGGSLARLGSYKSDNLANSRAQGTEVSANFRPNSRIFITGSYTFLDSEILSLDGTSSLAPQYFHVGQWLLRRPRNYGSLSSTFFYKRISANVIGVFRGRTLDTEPNFGAFGGLYNNPGYANLGINLNYEMGGGVTLYGNLRNALNQRYEEILGFPSPRLNFVAGIKWRLTRER
jgi:outer membrane cobalamin receptor